MEVKIIKGKEIIFSSACELIVALNQIRVNFIQLVSFGTLDHYFYSFSDLLECINLLYSCCFLLYRALNVNILAVVVFFQFWHLLTLAVRRNILALGYRLLIFFFKGGISYVGLITFLFILATFRIPINLLRSSVTAIFVL